MSRPSTGAWIDLTLLPMTNDLRIEKLRRPVTIVLTGGTRADGDIFLASRARYRLGAEEPFDLLNDELPYFPLGTPDGETVLVAKEHVLLVETGTPVDDPIDAASLGLSVEMILADGSTHRGLLFPETTRDRPRLLDFLNGYSLHFLPLFADGRMYLLNRRQIARVRAVT